MTFAEIMANIEKWLRLFGLTPVSALFALFAAVALFAAAYALAKHAWKTWFAGHPVLAGAELMAVAAIWFAICTGLVLAMGNAMDNQLAQLGPDTATGPVLNVMLKWAAIGLLGVIAITMAFVALVVMGWPQPKKLRTWSTVDQAELAQLARRTTGDPVM